MTKRCFDLITSTLLLLVFSLLILPIALVIIVSSGFPVLYRGKRVGRDGKIFIMYKFRTMVPKAESLGGPSTALNDSRLTSVGKLLRKYKLDELPQLINVFKGNMSIVGPRPQVERYTSLYNEEEMKILSVKPGITDYASIKLIHLDSLLGTEDVDNKYITEIEPIKNQLRLKYVYEKSFYTDIKILFLTLMQLFRIRGLWNTQN